MVYTAPENQKFFIYKKSNTEEFETRFPFPFFNLLSRFEFHFIQNFKHRISLNSVYFDVTCLTEKLLSTVLISSKTNVEFNLVVRQSGFWGKERPKTVNPLSFSRFFFQVIINQIKNQIKLKLKLFFRSRLCCSCINFRTTKLFKQLTRPKIFLNKSVTFTSNSDIKMNSWLKSSTCLAS